VDDASTRRRGGYAHGAGRFLILARETVVPSGRVRDAGPPGTLVEVRPGGQESVMYIGAGTIVLILLIVVIVMLMRGRRV